MNDIETLKNLRDEIPPDTEELVRESWLNYMQARIDKAEKDKARKR